jgi:hypothetical protein
MVFGNTLNLLNYFWKAKYLEGIAPCYDPLVYHSLDVAAVSCQLLKTDFYSKK